MKRTTHVIDFIRPIENSPGCRQIALFKILTRCRMSTDEVRDLFFKTLRFWLSTRDGMRALSNSDGDFTLWDYQILAGNTSLKAALFAVGVKSVQVDIQTSHQGDPAKFNYCRPSALAA